MTKPIAQITRMELPHYNCAFGTKARDLLIESGYEVDETVLRTREDVDIYKAKLGVSTTPQVFINKKRIGGYTELRAHLKEQGIDVKGFDLSPKTIVLLSGVALMILWAFS
ncbi:MAG: glutaredoxin domain-containing protein [Litoreibacter sp.]